MSEHVSADGYPVEPGAKFWDRYLTVVQVTEVAVHSNWYPGGRIQTWHRTTGGEVSTVNRGLAADGSRIERYHDGKDAETQPPGRYIKNYE